MQSDTPPAPGQFDSLIRRVPQSFTAMWTKKEPPLNFPSKCAYCGSTDDLTTVKLTTHDMAANMNNFRQRVPYCSRHAKVLRFRQRTMAIGTVIGGLLGIALVIVLHSARVFVIGNVGFNVVIGLPVGMVLGIIAAFIVIRTCTSEEHRALAERTEPPVAVVAVTSSAYVLRFLNRAYQQEFETLNREHVI